MSTKNDDAMEFDIAMEIAESMDLPDGAFWAMSHELAGLEYGDGFALLGGRNSVEKKIPCAVCGKKFATNSAKKQHYRAVHREAS